MRGSFYALILGIFIMLISSSCGNSGDLGMVNGDPVTQEEYLTVFNNLPADMQVSILEPGGRLELMNRLVMKKTLLTAWQDNPEVSQGWEELYSVSMLSDSMLNRLGGNFDQQAYVDSMTECGYAGFNLRVTLLDDSVSAVEMAENWNSGNFEASELSLSAPWSLADGSSYRTFTGPVHRITTSFLPLLDLETGVSHVLPMYGEWAVCLLNLTPGEWVPADEVISLGFMSTIAKVTPHTILSKGITELAANCVISGTRIVPSGSGNQEVIVLFANDTLTVSDILDIMEKADSVNFPGELPVELESFAAPEVFSTTEVALWFYVKAIAQEYSLAALATSEGITLADNALDFARAESVIRSRVLEHSFPDSSAVVAWYEQNSELFLIPERRSVLLGYTDVSTAISLDSTTVFDFDDVPGCQTVLTETGEMLATPPQIQQAFGQQLGSAIFSAEPGIFTGPIMVDEELAAWFEVVEVISPEIASLDDVFLHAQQLTASSMFSSGFESLIDELFVTYSVEIDTAAVVEIDLWGGSR